MSELLKVSSNPHVRARMKTDNIMLLVLIAPFSEFLLQAEVFMLNSLSDILRLTV